MEVHTGMDNEQQRAEERTQKIVSTKSMRCVMNVLYVFELGEWVVPVLKYDVTNNTAGADGYRLG
jgi:hypothetical protein